ncbi:MAG TPA: hypothetical protein VMU02_01540 [bacterium]|nr:hypothetical protein [bacterium]
MTSKTATLGVLALVALALILWGGLGQAQQPQPGKQGQQPPQAQQAQQPQQAPQARQGKQIMVVFTTDDNGEVNPCG